jgi:hypothetical protein
MFVSFSLGAKARVDGAILSKQTIDKKRKKRVKTIAYLDIKP